MLTEASGVVSPAVALVRLKDRDFLPEELFLVGEWSRLREKKLLPEGLLPVDKWPCLLENIALNLLRSETESVVSPLLSWPANELASTFAELMPDLALVCSPERPQVMDGFHLYARQLMLSGPDMLESASLNVQGEY